MTVVFVLLSKEYPMAETGWEEQLAAVAESVKGDETWAPLPGLLTVTPANAGLARKASRAEPMESLRSNFMKVTPYASIWVVQTGLKRRRAASRERTPPKPRNLAHGRWVALVRPVAIERGDRERFQSVIKRMVHISQLCQSFFSLDSKKI